jgi:hypothetical protein
LLFVTATACAQDLKSVAAAAQPPPPPPVFSWGGDFRVRYEAYDSVQTLSSDAPFHIRDFFRFRLRVWENYNLLPNLAFYARGAAEPRYWFNAASVAAEGKEWRYGILDNVYIKWDTTIDDTSVSIVAGRQDIQLGDQWLMSEGTPSDGSWTNFVDGLRATFDVKSIKTKFDAMTFKQRAYPWGDFPVLGRGDKKYTLTEQDEIGAIFYASNKSIENTQLDGYFIYKNDKQVASTGNDGKIYTLGARIAGTPSAKWLYTAEAAYQWGERSLMVRYPLPLSYNMRDIAAYGLNAKLTHLFKDKLGNQLCVQAEYLSGDDPSTTDKDEMFDNLWGRFPRLGETWAAAYALESGGRSSQFQNLFRIGGTWTIAPTKTTSIATTYYAMYAPEAVATRTTNASRFSGTGHFRGHMLQTIVRQKFTKTISGLLFAEASFLGDYYTQHDTMTFVRAEVMITF